MVEQLTKSPSVIAYFQNPTDKELMENARSKFIFYKETFPSDTIFWINDIDKKLYHNMKCTNILDPNLPEFAWYNKTIYNTVKYNFNINYNKDIDQTLIWINAPVRDNTGKAIGAVGTGIELTGYIASLFSDLDEDLSMYVYENSLIIIRAKDNELIKTDNFINDIYTNVEDERDFRATENTLISLPHYELYIAQVSSVELNLIFCREFDTMAKIHFSNTPFLIIVVINLFISFILLAISLFRNLKLLQLAVDDLSSRNADLTQRIRMKEGRTTRF